MSDGKRVNVAGGVGVAADVVSILTTLWPYGIPLAVAVLALAKTVPSIPITSLIGTFAIIGAVVTVLLGAQRFAYLKRVSAPNLNPYWKMEKTSAHASVNSPISIDYEYEIVVVARRAGESVIRYSTTWTGSGKFLVESLTPGVHAVMDELESGLTETFHLSLSQPCKRGERRTLRYRIKTIGDNGRQRPFWSRSIQHLNYPKRDNVMVLTFAEGLKIEQLWEEHFLIPGPPWPSFQRSLGPLGVDRTARISFNRRVGHRFGFRWTYGGN